MTNGVYDVYDVYDAFLTNPITKSSIITDLSHSSSLVFTGELSEQERHRNTLPTAWKNTHQSLPLIIFLWPPECGH